MPDLLKVGQSGRARFTDTPADGAGSLNSSPNLAENETMVEHYPPGVHPGGKQPILGTAAEVSAMTTARAGARWSAYRAALVQDAAAKFGD